MIDIIAKTGQRLDLGFQGETGTRRLVFDLSNWQKNLGEGQVQVVVHRAEDADDTVYFLNSDTDKNNLHIDGDKAYATLTSIETAQSGFGSLELRYFVDPSPSVVYSRIWETFVEKSMTDGDTFVPATVDNWVNSVLASASTAKASETAAKLSETNAKASETAAKACENAVKAASEGLISTASQAVTSISQSTSAAANSATQAAASATAAKDSADKAAVSKVAAAASEQRVISEVAKVGTYAGAAQASATQAAASATLAQSAITAAEQAQASAVSAAASADKAELAESWAVGGTGKRTGEDTDNAKYYAGVAEAQAERMTVPEQRNLYNLILRDRTTNANYALIVDSARLYLLEISSNATPVEPSIVDTVTGTAFKLIAENGKLKLEEV